MPWIAVDEPFAKPPRPATVAQYPEWSEPLEVDRGWAELKEVTVSVDSAIDFDGCQDLTVADSSLTGVTLNADDADLTVEIHRSHLDGCDLSGRTVRTARSTRFTACKLIGTDFSGGAVADVVFERCVFRYTNLRMAKLSRVEFVDCSLDDVDCYQMAAEDVAFPGTDLSTVNLDGLAATRFDLREAGEITLSAIGRLDGCLVSEHQLAGMAHSLAMAAGVQVERPAHDDG